MITDIVQKTIEGTIIDYWEILSQFIDKCSFCNDYKRIVSQNCYGIPMMCKDCSDLFFNADKNGKSNPKLHKLRIEYQKRLMDRK